MSHGAGNRRHPQLLSVEELGHGQCGAKHLQKIEAPVADVWAIIRQFDSPHAYKPFVHSCRLVSGNGGPGSVREVRVVSGLPATSSSERLQVLDDDRCLMMVEIIGGDHPPCRGSREGGPRFLSRTQSTSRRGTPPMKPGSLWAHL